MNDRELNMWRFVGGIACGIVLAVIVMFSLPLKWDDDPDKKLIGKAQNKLVIVIGTDQSMTFISEIRQNSYNDSDRAIRIFQNPVEAEDCRRRVLDQLVPKK